jgi:hypothetical protein
LTSASESASALALDALMRKKRTVKQIRPVFWMVGFI